VKYYESDAHIETSPTRIWSILIDGAGYPDWDSGVESVEGSIADGKRIKVRSELSPGRAFPVTVRLSDDCSTMTWTGGMPLGLFRGVRTFTLESPDGLSTAFRMREEYTGVLVPLMWKTMPDLGPSFSQFALGLKQRCEAAGADQ
jgi:hypothetical protein